MAESAVNFLLANLARLLLQEYNLPSDVKQKITLLRDQMEVLAAILKVSEQKRNKDEVITKVVDQIREVIHEAEDIIDTYVYDLNRQRIERWWNPVNYVTHSKLLHDLADKIDKIEKRIEKINSNKELGMGFCQDYPREAEAEVVAAADLKKRRREVEKDDVVGFDGYSDVVINRLTGGHRQRKVISIIGMGGQGKTTLARKIYNNDRVKGYFKSFAWTDVSEDWEATTLLLNLLAQVGSSRHQQKSIEDLKQEIQKELDLSSSKEMSMEDLIKQKIRESMKGKQYLVVLDDIWKPEVWSAIQNAFPDDENGSRILITTRFDQVARVANPSSESMYKLPCLSKEQSWELLSKRVFKGEHCPPELEDLGKQMAESCDGLPLSIVVLAGILVTLERSKATWSIVRGDVIWYLSREKDKCMAILALSFNHLPQHLKPCFLYVGIYPEDYKIPARELIRLWVAEGLIQGDTGNKQPEDDAEYYLVELIDRSLIQVESKRTDGGVKTCRIHDLLRALCIQESRKEKFYDVVANKNNSNLANPRRLFLHQKGSTYLSSSLGANHSSVRSLIFFTKDPFENSYICLWKNKKSSIYWKSILEGFKLVRVLDVYETWIERIPNRIMQLIHLRYLKIDMAISSIPDEILNLWNLETLDLSRRIWSSVKLPRKIGKLNCLRHLLLPGETKMPRLYGLLDNLQTLSTVALKDDLGSIFTNMRKLRKLGLHYENKYRWNPGKFWPTLPTLSDLKTLKIWGPAILPEEVGLFPSNLTKITLIYRWEIDSHALELLGAIPNLQILKFFYCGNVDIDCKSEHFQKLEVFQMKYAGCENWHLSRGAMPHLQSLSIFSCNDLTKLPDELWSLPELRNVAVADPSKEMANYLAKLKMKDGCKLTIL